MPKSAVLPKDIQLLLKIRDFERALRDVIKGVIEGTYGPKWWDFKENENLALEKVKNKVKENHGKTRAIMEKEKEPYSNDFYNYMEFSHYGVIIIELWETKAGKPLFSKFFPRKEFVNAYLEYLNIHRNDILGHDRAVLTADVENKIDFYIRDFSKYFPQDSEILAGVDKSIFGQIESFQEILKKKPKDVKTLFDLANALGNIENLFEAELIYQKILEIDPKNIDALIGLVCNYLLRKKLEEAKVILDKTFSIEPGNDCALYNLACYYSLKGNEKEALNILSKICPKDNHWKESASGDSDFNNIRNSKKFQELIS